MAVINCGEPEIPMGGYVTGYKCEIGSQVEYHCDPGYYLTGTNTRECTRNGTWSQTAPNCTCE